MSSIIDPSIKLNELILDPYTCTTIIEKYRNEKLLKLYLLQTTTKGKFKIIEYKCISEIFNETDCCECGDILNNNSILITYADIIPIKSVRSLIKPPNQQNPFSVPICRNNFVCDGHKGYIKCALCDTFIWEKTILFPFSLKTESTHRYYCKSHLIETLRKNILLIASLS